MGIIQVKGGFVHKNAMSPEAMQRMRQVVRRSFTRAVPQDGDPDRRVWYRRYLLTTPLYLRRALHVCAAQRWQRAKCFVVAT